MSSVPPSELPGERKPTLSLDELAAFCRELSALVRAQVPLGVGLRSGAFSSGTGMTAAAERLAAYEEQGRNLSDALAAESATWPPAMRAVIESGRATGRLSEALESIARCAQMQADARVRVGAALVYPGVLLMTASWLMGLVANRLITGIEGIYDTGPEPHPAWLDSLIPVARTAWIWCHIVPVIVLVSAIAWRFRGRRGSVRATRMPLILRWAPGLWGIERNFRIGLLSDFLAMLTAHGVPLPKAWVLASEATGDEPTIEAGRRIAEAVAGAKPQSEAIRASGSFPPLFASIVESAERQGGLTSGYHQLSEVYYRRAERQSEWARATLPIVMTITLGIGVVAVYAAAVFLPVLRMLYDMLTETA